MFGAATIGEELLMMNMADFGPTTREPEKGDRVRILPTENPHVRQFEGQEGKVIGKRFEYFHIRLDSGVKCNIKESQLEVVSRAAK